MECIFCQLDRPVLAQTKLSVAFLDASLLPEVTPSSFQNDTLHRYGR